MCMCVCVFVCVRVGVHRPCITPSLWVLNQFGSVLDYLGPLCWFWLASVGFVSVVCVSLCRFAPVWCQSGSFGFFGGHFVSVSVGFGSVMVS